MKPVFMQCHHDPSIGAYGDCFRACIASLLELPAEEVPHFFDYPEEQDAELGYQRLDAFLERRGLAYFTFPLFPEDLAALSPVLFHTVLVGVENATGTTHAVVAYGGRPVHNPDPRGSLEVDTLDGAGLAPHFVVGIIRIR